MPRWLAGKIETKLLRHQVRGWGDGEDGESGDEKEKERDIIGRRFVIMKSLTAILMGVAVLIVISSCANFPTSRLDQKGLSLGTKADRVQTARAIKCGLLQIGIAANVEYWTTINFVADRKPNILRACFNFSGGSQSCVDVQEKDVTYGLHTYFRVPIHVPAGSKKIDCYAEYIRDGKTQRTNIVTYYVIVLKEPEK
jgi:hypothetical protein